MPGRIESLLAMLERGQDSALLRFSLGNEYLGEEEYVLAAEHLQHAVALDPNYSVACKLLGKALAKQNCNAQAIETYRHAIEIAEELAQFVEDGRPRNPEMLGYMLRGFFVSQRRHIAWENMPVATTAPVAWPKRPKNVLRLVSMKNLLEGPR